MRPRRLYVHLGGPLNPILLAPSKQDHAIGLALHDVLGKPLDIYPLKLVFPNL